MTSHFVTHRPLNPLTYIHIEMPMLTNFVNPLLAKSIIKSALFYANPLHIFLWLTLVSIAILAPITMAAKDTTVITKTITTTAITPTFEALGTLKAYESTILSSTITDTVDTIYFDDGDEVNAGDVLVEMTHAEEKALLQEAKSSLAEAKRQYDRLVTLIKTDSTSQSLLDETRLSYESAKARLAAAQARLDNHIIKAPFSGRVGLRDISVGTLVTPGDAITTLDKVDALKLDITLPATALSSVRKGISMSAVALANTKANHTAVISSVDTRVDPITRSILVRATVQNQTFALLPGMQMRAQIESQPQNVLLIPEEALVRNGDKEYVFLAKEDNGQLIAKQQYIATSLRYQGQLIVESGLESGDIVVIHGALKLKDKSPVRILAEEKDNETLRELLKSSKSITSNTQEP